MRRTGSGVAEAPGRFSGVPFVLRGYPQYGRGRGPPDQAPVLLLEVILLRKVVRRALVYDRERAVLLVTKLQARGGIPALHQR